MVPPSAAWSPQGDVCSVAVSTEQVARLARHLAGGESRSGGVDTQWHWSQSAPDTGPRWSSASP